MAELSPLNVDPGSESGRIAPAPGSFALIDGTWLFCLGHVDAGFKQFLNVGDHVSVSQSVTFDGTTKILKWDVLRTRGPAESPPASLAWKASVFVGGIEKTHRILSGTENADWVDWVTSIDGVSAGAHAVEMRLSLVASGVGSPPTEMVEVEIPAFFFDTLQASPATPSSPFITNFSPDDQFGFGGGPAPDPGAAIAFEILSFTASGIDQATIHVTVTVNGGSPVDAIVGGVFQAGFSGSIGSTSASEASVIFTPAAPFPSSATIVVSVTAHLLDATSGTASWTFKCKDTIAPTLASASATDTKMIRAVWSENVTLLSDSGSHDALNPSLYSIVPKDDPAVTFVPAVTPRVVLVSQVSADSVDIATDIELSPGVIYTLIANGIEDAAGNYTASTADFTAFVPPAPANRSFDLWRMLPRINRDEDDRKELLRFVRCLQEIVTLILYDIDRWTDIIDPDIAPERYLDAMLDDLGNPFAFELAEIDKRRLIRVLVQMYRQKGTAAGIINVVRFFVGVEVTISTNTGIGMKLGISKLGVDWILGPGTSFALYSFRVVASVPLTDDQRTRIRAIAEYMKPAHTHLVEIVEPPAPSPPNHLVLGLSQLGVNWKLHSP